ncbi:hypothetical protein ND16A_1527 [Thalassotalea sp. ND16A]|nr:hypothetical protein ND16A_1527 [Thalassotalea sp. ND16A]
MGPGHSFICNQGLTTQLLSKLLFVLTSVNLQLLYQFGLLF